jgi:flagellar biosynthesis protein FliP
MPNCSSSIYDLSSLETSNSFSPLTEKSVSSPGLPKASSSPQKRYMCKKNKKKDIALKVLNINVQSIEKQKTRNR